MKIFRYDGLYYPVIGNATLWENRNYKITWMKKLGGYTGFFSFLPYIGIKCKLKNYKKPYKQFIIDAINNHKQMKIHKWYFNEKHPEHGYMFIVRTTNGSYIGDIDTAYSLTWLTHIASINKVACYGWSEEKQCAIGWSHRSRCCFKKGDKVFEEKYGDDFTPYIKHGRKTIRNYSDTMKAALNFAKYIS